MSTCQQKGCSNPTEGKKIYCATCRVIRAKATHLKSYLKHEALKKHRMKREKCTACGIRQRAKGNRFLCATCFRNNGEVDFGYAVNTYHDGQPSIFA